MLYNLLPPLYCMSYRRTDSKIKKHNIDESQFFLSSLSSVGLGEGCLGRSSSLIIHGKHFYIGTFSLVSGKYDPARWWPGNCICCTPWHTNDIVTHLLRLIANKSDITCKTVSGILLLICFYLLLPQQQHCHTPLTHFFFR